MKKLIVAVTMLGATAVFAADKFELKGDVAKGIEVFKTYCVACHGDKGDGTGPAGAALNPKPADFTDPVRAAKMTDELVYKTITEGGVPYGKSPLMVSWKGTLNDQQIRDVASFIRTLAKKGAAAPAAKTPPPQKKK